MSIFAAVKNAVLFLLRRNKPFAEKKILRRAQIMSIDSLEQAETRWRDRASCLL
jgi:hypothetical protein